ncbi:MAG: DNA mismatch endonuclease Vsr [Actinobacteria bacterium]|nr:DNA mismatch endonuclease Vsr [Actinomycetota bacterium]
MFDPLTKAERSALMSKVRSMGAKSTEQAVEASLHEHKITGWEKHPASQPGKPDIYFAKCKLALFVDGCFWHGCPIHGRIPKSQIEFWTEKIEANRKRDNRVRRKMRKEGYHVMRVWEHDVKGESWIKRLQSMLKRIERNQGD